MKNLLIILNLILASLSCSETPKPINKNFEIYINESKHQGTAMRPNIESTNSPWGNQIKGKYGTYSIKIYYISSIGKIDKYSVSLVTPKTKIKKEISYRGTTMELFKDQNYSMGIRPTPQ